MQLSLTLEIERDHDIGFLPLGHNDKVMGRAAPLSEAGRLALSKAQNLRKDSVESEDEPHMIPESAVVTSLKDLRPDRFYLLVYIRPKPAN